MSVLDELDLDLDFLRDASRFMVTMMLRWCCWVLRLFYDVVDICWLMTDVNTVCSLQLYGFGPFDLAMDLLTMNDEF